MRMGELVMGHRRQQRSALASEVSTLFGQLGDSPEDVAESLGRQGVTGRQASDTQCPLARYLNAVLGAEHHVKGVDVGSRVVRIRVGWPWSPPIFVSLPGPVGRFVGDFDRGRFPALVESAPAVPMVATDPTGP
jgi:hypothetical protein